MKRKLILTESELKVLLKSIVKEALLPSQFRKYVKDFDKERYIDMFKSLGDKYSHDKKYYRIYIPLQEESKKGPVSETEKQVRSFLEQSGYKDIDYIKGTCRFGESKNLTTIGKALSRMKNNDLMNKFVSDESRKSLTSNASDLMVVISRHPYDIAGSDTDRNWTNCMTMGHSDSPRVAKLNDELKKLKYKLELLEVEYSDKSGFKKVKLNPNKDDEDNYGYLSTNEFLGSPLHKVIKRIGEINKELEERKEEGSNVMYILSEIKGGSLISYLIRKDDKNIQNPLAVLNIKPYVNKNNKNDFILVSDEKMYGQGRPEFKGTVDGILKEINGNKSGLFCLKQSMYQDSQRDVLITGEKDDKLVSQAYEEIKKIVTPEYVKKHLSKTFDIMAHDEISSAEEEIENELLDDEDYEPVNHYDKLEKIVFSKKNEIISEYEDLVIDIDIEKVKSNYFNYQYGIEDVKRIVNDYLETLDFDESVDMMYDIKQICDDYVAKVLGY